MVLDWGFRCFCDIRETAQTNEFMPYLFLLVNTVKHNQSKPNSFYPSYQSALSRSLLRFCGNLCWNSRAFLRADGYWKRRYCMLGPYYLPGFYTTRSSLIKRRYSAMWIWLSEDKVKVKIAHFRLPSWSQKRAFLSSKIFTAYRAPRSQLLSQLPLLYISLIYIAYRVTLSQLLKQFPLLFISLRLRTAYRVASY